MRTHTERRARRQSTNEGFTLIEFAIVAVLVGFMMAAFFTTLELVLKKSKIKTTADNIASVQRALAAHLDEFGDLPCPAPLDAGPGDAGFGAEINSNGNDAVDALGAAVFDEETGDPVPAPDCEDNIALEDRLAADATPGTGAGFDTVLEDTAAPTGDLGDGTYRVKSVRAVQRPAAGGGAEDDDIYIRIGAVPFRSLNLPMEKTLDGYGSRLIYAVTERAAAGNITGSGWQGGDFPVTAQGGISVVDGSGTSLLDEERPDTALFFLVAPGPDNKGGYSREGILRAACAGTGVDIENCDFLEGTFNPTFAVSEYSTNTGDASFYDDVAAYDLVPAEGSLVDDALRCMNIGKIYMPLSTRADVNGCVDVVDANESCPDNQQIFYDDVTEAFSCRDLRVTPPQIDGLPTCAADEYLRYDGTDIVCATGVREITGGSCAAGQIVKSISATGTVTCGSPPASGGQGSICGLAVPGYDPHPSCLGMLQGSCMLRNDSVLATCQGHNPVDSCPPGYVQGSMDIGHVAGGPGVGTHRSIIACVKSGD